MIVSRGVVKRAWLLAVLVVGAFFGAWNGVEASAADGITLSVSANSIVLPIIPASSEGTFAASDDITVDVTSTGLGGYTLLIRATGSNELVSSGNSIPSITESVSADDFEGLTTYNNKWGYLPSKLNSSSNINYQPGPGLEGDIIEKTTEDAASGSYTISLGARVNLQTPPGDYSNVFVIAAVANNTCNPNAGSILEAYCMQDMNDAVANSMVVNKQYVLMDNRDGTVYYIAKMKDGRVWMTQNLDLLLRNDTESPDFTPLTSNNTDINTSGSGIYVEGYTTSGGVITWTPGSATTSSGWSGNNNTPASYDNGDTYYYTDTSGNTTTYSDKATCEAAHTDDTCAHYHSGNYYNFSAAVASNNTSGITSGVAANSICPKGWRLPNNSSGYGDANQTWLAEGITTGIVTAAEHYGVYGNNGYINISNSPVYLTRSGLRNSNSSPQKLTNGYFRTGSVNDATYAWTYYFTPVYPYPYERYATTDGYWVSRTYQLPVRCVARQSNTGTSTTVVFNANGGTGTMVNKVIANGSSAGLTANAFTREGYVFTGWNTASDGSGINYANTATYYAAVGTLPVNVTLYAQWAVAHTITVNGGTGIKVSVNNGTDWTAAGGSTTLVAGEGQTVILKAKDDTSGTVFSSWSKDSGVGDFTSTAWRNGKTKTTSFVVGTGDATVTANGTTSYTTIGTTKVNMQDVTACPDWLATGTVYQVADIRTTGDYGTYNVAKLNDGKCWLLENMRLDPTTATLDSTNTNATDAQLTDYKAKVVAKTTGFSSYDTPMVNVAHIDNTASYGSDIGKVGVYYNYCAASAGTVCTSGDTGSLDAAVDVCPKGWRMPTGGAVDNVTGFGEYQALYSAYNNNATNFKNALRAPLSGYFYGSTQYNLGSYGYFWSSTFYGGLYSYILSVYSSGVNPQNYGSRSYGFSMRCVFGG